MALCNAARKDREAKQTFFDHSKQTKIMPLLCKSHLILQNTYINPSLTLARCLHVSQGLQSRKNFRKFTYLNLVGQYDIKHTPKHLLGREYAFPLHQDTMKQRYPGYWMDYFFRTSHKKVFVPVKEMEPELMVPELADFKLLPYVSYRAPEVAQTEMTARDLFLKVYSGKIVSNHDKGEKEFNVTQEEIESARLKAQQTGADLFVDDSYMGIPRIRTDEWLANEREKDLKRWKKFGTLAKSEEEQLEMEENGGDPTHPLELEKSF